MQEPQSRQSAKIFTQSLELGLPNPHSRRRVLVGGKGTLACGRGVGGVPIPTKGHTLWCSVYISTYLWQGSVFCPEARTKTTRVQLASGSAIRGKGHKR